MERTLKFRHQRSADDMLECFDSWILLTMLGSRDMAKFVSQEAYDRAGLPETSAHVIDHMLLQFVIEHVLFFQSSSVFPLVSCLICSSKPLCNACPGCGGMVHIRKVSCSCGHVFVAKHKKHLKAYTA